MRRADFDMDHCGFGGTGSRSIVLRDDGRVFAIPVHHVFSAETIQLPVLRAQRAVQAGVWEPVHS